MDVPRASPLRSPVGPVKTSQLCCNMREPDPHSTSLPDPIPARQKLVAGRWSLVAGAGMRTYLETRARV